MINTETLSLVEGNFSEEDAKEILINLFSSKLNFHNIKNWSSNERFAKDDEIAKNRIPALKKEVQKLEGILAEAKKQNKNLLVNAEIKITLIDK